MALHGCCCCGLRGGAKAVGVFFLVMSLIALIGVITTWAVCVRVPTQSVGFDVDTSEGKFGLQARETHSAFGGTGEDFRVSLGKLGTFGASSDGRVKLGKFGSMDVSSDGRVSMHSSDGGENLNVPFIEWMPRDYQIALISSTVYVVLAVIFNSMLIHGADNDSSCAVLGWLAFYGIVFPMHTFGSIGGLIYGFTIAGTAAGPPLLVGAGLGVLTSALLWFWWALVLTFYHELRNGTRGFRYQRDLALREPPASHVPGPNGQRKAEGCA